MSANSAGLRDPNVAAKRTAALLRHLFDPPPLGTWAVLDGASIKGLVRAIATHGVRSVCLLAGKLHPSMARVAPYLVELEESSSFSAWMLENGWGQHWGIFLRSRADLGALRKHLRRFLLVRDPDGKRMHFRYYDPRVLRVYLPTCSAEEVASFFGPVGSYGMESESGDELLVFTREPAAGASTPVAEGLFRNVHALA